MNARTMQTEINGTFRSMKNSSLNFRKFALTNGTTFSEIYEHKVCFPFDQTRSPGLLIKLNFRCEFPWANGTEFSSVKNDKPEFFCVNRKQDTDMSTSRLFIDHNSRDFIQTTTAVKMLQNKGFNESYNGSARNLNLCTFPSQRTQNKQVH